MCGHVHGGLVADRVLSLPEGGSGLIDTLARGRVVWLQTSTDLVLCVEVDTTVAGKSCQHCSGKE